MSYELADVERELCRIPEVRAARIVADLDGRPVEVHVLAAPGKHAKQVVRDVQSVAMATVGLSIDHRIVSVVQLDDLPVVPNPAPAVVEQVEQVEHDQVDPEDDEEPEDEGVAPGADEAAREAGVGDAAGDEAEGRSSPSKVDGADADDVKPATPRIGVERVLVLRRGITCTAEVVLRAGDQIVTGDADGSGASSAVRRLVADATLDALRQLHPETMRAYVESAVLARVGEHEIAMTTVVVVNPPNEELVTGSALVRGAGEHDAIARSLLDALNRRLDGRERTSRS